MSVSVPAEHIRSLAAELQLRPAQVEAAARLLGEDATVPFIARYRKEATGGLDELAVTAVRAWLHGHPASSVCSVVFCCFSEASAEAHRRALAEIPAASR